MRCRVAATGLLLKRIFSPNVKDGTPPSVGLCACCPPALPGARRAYTCTPRRALGGSGHAKSDHNGLSLKAYLFTSHTRTLERILVRAWGMRCLPTPGRCAHDLHMRYMRRARGPGNAHDVLNRQGTQTYLFVYFPSAALERLLERVWACRALPRCLTHAGHMYSLCAPRKGGWWSPGRAAAARQWRRIFRLSLAPSQKVEVQREKKKLSP